MQKNLSNRVDFNGLIDKRGLSILAICLLAFIVRFIYLFEISNYPNFKIYYAGLDAELYHFLALKVASGDLLLGNDVYYYSPFYAYLLGFLYFLFGSGTWVPRLSNIAFGVTTVIFIYMYTRDFFKSHTIGYIAALGAALYGPFLVFDTSALKTSSGICLMAISIYLLGRSLHSRKIGTWMLTGIFAGLAMVNFGHFTLSVFTLCIWLIFCLLRPDTSNMPIIDRGRWLPLLLFPAGIMIAVIPFTIRNYIVSGEFVPTTCTSGIHLFIGNHEGAWGGYNRIKEIRPNPAGHFFDASELAKDVTGKELKAAEVSAFWKNQAVTYIKKNPIDFLRLSAKRVLLALHAYEIDNNENYQYLTAISPYLSVFIRFAVLLPLGLAGMILSFRIKGNLVPLYLLFFSYLFSLGISFISWRYRLPLTLFLFPFAGYMIIHMIRLYKTKKYFIFASGVIMVMVIFIIPYLQPVNQKTVHSGLKIAAGKMKACEKEGELLNLINDPKIISVNDQITAWINLARLRERNHDTEGAIRYLQEALNNLPHQQPILRELERYRTPANIIHHEN